MTTPKLLPVQEALERIENDFKDFDTPSDYPHFTADLKAVCAALRASLQDSELLDWLQLQSSLPFGKRLLFTRFPSDEIREQLRQEKGND